MSAATVENCRQNKYPGRDLVVAVVHHEGCVGAGGGVIISLNSEDDRFFLVCLFS